MIKNYDEVVKELTELLMMFDIEKRGYQRDVYVYIDESDNATLYVYDNIGGNSCIDDKHYVVYRDKPHFETIFDFYDEHGLDEVCDALDVYTYDFTFSVAKFADCDIDEVDMNDIERYVYNHNEMLIALLEHYIKYVNELYNSYYDTASYYINTLLDEIEEE